MDEAILRDLQRRVKALEQGTSMRMGVVTATAPLTVEVGAAGVPYAGVNRFAGYIPTIGDKVRVEITNGNCLVYDRIA